MTLEEAIKHAEKVAEENENNAQMWHKQTKNRLVDFCDKAIQAENNCIKCAKEHRQLAEWLRDYKRLLEQEPCEDAISRKDTLKAMIEQLGIRNEDYLIPAEATLYNVVKNMPPVNPQPKIGHWINGDCKGGNCSICGEYYAFYPESGDFNYCPNCGAKMVEQESEDKIDSEPTASRFKCRAEQGSWCKRWERECVSWEHCELSSYNFPCPGCVMSSPLEREECDNCCWKDEKQKHYQP